MAVLTCSGLLVAMTPLASNATIVTFDDPITTTASGFNTQGYSFNVATNHYHLESTDPRFSTSSSTTSLIVDDFSGDNKLTLTSQDGGGFNLTSLSIVSAGIDFGSTIVAITAALVGGGTLSFMYHDPDFGTFETLNLNWTNLMSVTFDGIGNPGFGLNFFRLDDINVTAAAVPEPVSLMLFAFGLMGIGFSRMRKQK